MGALVEPRCVREAGRGTSQLQAPTPGVRATEEWRKDDTVICWLKGGTLLLCFRYFRNTCFVPTRRDCESIGKYLQKGTNLQRILSQSRSVGAYNGGG